MGCSSSPSSNAQTASPSPSAQASAQPEKKAEGNEFKSETGRFMVVSPIALEEKTAEMESPVGKLNTHTFAGERKNKAIFSVMYVDYPENLIKESDPAKVIEGAATGSVKNVNGTNVVSTDISIGKHSAKEVTADVKGNKPGEEGTIKQRFVLVGNRMYQVMVLGVKGEVTMAEMDTFLQSFKLSEEKKPS